MDALIHRSRRSVTLDDWKKLADAGDFGSGYLHLESDRHRLAQ